MSITDTTCRLPEEPNQLVFLTAVPAAEIVGINRQTLAKHLQPDAWYTSARGDKQWPLWLRSTLEAYRDERLGGGE
jgi:hypothetical protein